MRTNPKISVLLLTWNRKEDLELSIASVLQQKMADEIEIVLVDSASTDGTGELIAEKYPQIKYIRLPYNLGVIGGRNMGVANCTGELVFLLDDDAVFLEKNALEKVCQEFDTDPRLAALFCKIVNEEGKIFPWTFRGPVEKYGDKELVSYHYIGAAHCVRRKLFDELGYMDASYFRNGEEMEFSLKAYGAGYYVLYYPRVSVLHRPNQISRNPKGRTFFYKFRNDILTHWKYLPVSHAVVFTSMNLVLDGIRAIKWFYIHWYLWAILHLLVRLPNVIVTQRRPIPAGRLALWYKTWSEVVERSQLDSPETATGSLAGYIASYVHKLRPAA